MRCIVKKALKIAIIGVVVFGLVFAGAGWYFSNVLRADALENSPPERFYETTVIEVTGDTVTLEEGPSDDVQLFADGVYGLAWETGYGQIGEIIDTDGDLVTRRFSHLSGQPLGLDHLTDVDSFAFPPDPAVLGRNYQTVQYESELGPMDAWLVEGQGSTWLVVIHGKGVGPVDGMRMLDAAGQRGMPALLITYRNDVDQPQDPSGFYQYGQTEWRDLEAAVEYAQGEGAEQVVLVGLSTGAGIILEYLDQAQSADHVAGIIFDSANIDLGATIDHVASQRKIPGTPLPLPQMLTSTAKWLAGMRFDIDWDALNYIEDEDYSIPTLAFHGGDDLRVPGETSESYANANPEVRLITVEDADHVESWNNDPERYKTEVEEFLGSLGS